MSKRLRASAPREVDAFLATHAGAEQRASSASPAVTPIR